MKIPQNVKFQPKNIGIILVPGFKKSLDDLLGHLILCSCIVNCNQN